MRIAYVVPNKYKENVAKLYAPFDKNLQVECKDLLFLHSGNKEKILKADIDLPFDLFNNYDYIIPVGADTLKHVCGLTGITKYNGMLVNEKFVPILDPNIISVKPQSAKDIETAFTKLNAILTGTSIKESDKDYLYIDDQDTFEHYLKTRLIPASFIVCDIETTSLSARKGTILGVGFSDGAHKGVYVDADIIAMYVDELQEIFNHTEVIFHNAKFDMAFMKREYGFVFPKFHDTLLLHYILDESVGSHGLKELAIKYTDLGDYERELTEYKKKFCRQHKIKLKDFNYGMIPLEVLAPYAMKDCDATFQIWNKFKPLVDKNARFSNVYNNILRPATKALMHIENNGGPISLDRLIALEKDYQIDIEETLNEILMHPAVRMFEDETGKTFNPNSVYHLREIFFNILGLPSLKKTATHKDSTDAEVLENLDHPLAEAIIELRQKMKLQKTYISNIKLNLDIDGRLRSNFNTTTTTSGRLSSSGALNYQNLPRDKNAGIKQMFKARDGFKIIQADLGTAEVYVASVLANDQFFQEAFIKGMDFHSYVAKAMFKLPCDVKEIKDLFPLERQAAKAITFGIMYGAGPSKIADEAGISFEEAQEFIKLYFNQARQLQSWIKDSLQYIRDNCYTFSVFGRKRRLPEAVAESKGVAKHAERSGLNFLIQSVASDITLMGLVDLVDWVESNNLIEKVKIFATVHDSIVAEVADDYVDIYCAKISECLKKDRGVSIKGQPIGVDVEVGDSWGSVSKYNDWKVKLAA